MMFLGRHTVSETEKDQCVEDEIDHRMGNGQDQPPARGQDPFAFRSQRGRIIDVFEHGEHGNTIEGISVESMILWEKSLNHLNAAVARWRNVRVDAHRRDKSRQHPIDQTSIVTTDIEKAIAGANERDRLPDPPMLKKAIERFHADGPDPRRRIPSML